MDTPARELSPATLTLDSADIERIRTHFALQRFTTASFSALFVIELYLMQYARVVAAPDVLVEIAALEGIGPTSTTKLPTQSRHPPLKGLWHKHFFSANAILRNLKNQWNSNSWLDRQITRLFRESESEYVDDSLINRLAVTAVDEALRTRTENTVLTGQWLIFAEHEGRRYYLSIAPHSKDRAGDQRIFEPILKVCGLEFPFLRLGC